MSNTATEPRVLAALSDLHSALADATTTGSKSDPVFAPSVRENLRVCLEHLALELGPGADRGASMAHLRFRQMAVAAAQLGNLTLSWLDQKGGA